MASKKTTKRPVKKAPVKKAAARIMPAQVVSAAECTCKSSCACWKKIFIFILGVVVGAVACCAICCKGGYKKIWGKKFGPRPEMFVNGCLDLSKVDCPEKLEQVKLKDADKDGCITKEEFFGEHKPAAGQRKFRKPRAPKAE